MSKAEFMGEIKIKSTAEIVKDCKATMENISEVYEATKFAFNCYGKSKEEAWDEAYGGVNMPWFVQDTLEAEFNRLWENA